MAKGGSFAGSIRRQKVAVAVAGLVTPCVQFIGAGAAGGACERRRPGGELQQKLEPEISGRTRLAARARRIRSAWSYGEAAEGLLGVGLRPRGEDLAIHWMRDSDAHHQQ